MDLQKIKALIDLLAESPLASLEVIEGDERVKLVKSKRRGGRSEARQAGDDAATPLAAARQTLEQPQPAGDAAPVAGSTRAAAANGAGGTSRLICAPMFGIVHLTPSPGEAPFVRAGDTVGEGQVLCTIEAMKMFNAIECERGGTVLEILVESGSEVESGQPLFRIG
ncbi:acetyl-CoA carboxylase biotin carboxyl carrier protein [Trinickia terrae]|uniref:Biotin carboxyl carrier protein of acetyl-CoA carboxylase n=1 Tax=Trinickia terrae TaxID=2571161 RepID=A0A4U1I3Y9_9BURK|nr:acetyl-CoA carboxylase biotin carboxyl carrier protein [Trinickia terrae]TKC87942.1 acetyl-CoA carboxylase biotin carboxyl carrier protein [Trinickia terrae]